MSNRASLAAPSLVRERAAGGYFDSPMLTAWLVAALAGSVLLAAGGTGIEWHEPDGRVVDPALAGWL